MSHGIPEALRAHSWCRIAVLSLALVSTLALALNFSGAKPIKEIHTVVTASNLRELKVPHDFSTIPKAVEAAQPGDLITIAASIYREYVTIAKSVTLQSDHSNYVLIVNPPDFKPRSTVLICNAPGVILNNLKVTHNAIPPRSAIVIEAGQTGSLPQ